MSINTAYEYLQQKKALLKQCLNLSEELISNIEEWDSVPDIISKREIVIRELKVLEDSTKPSIKASLTKEMKEELNQMIRLILDLDKDAASRIREEQKGIMDSLKTNTKGQKLIQYAQIPDIHSGQRLDYKK
jgi:hypothetical protein